MRYCNLQVSKHIHTHKHTHIHTYTHFSAHENVHHITHQHQPYVHIQTVYIMYCTNDCGSKSIFDAVRDYRLLSICRAPA